MDEIDQIFNYLPVSYNISTSGQPTRAEITALAECGCEVIINLGLHDDPIYSLKDEECHVKSLGVDYIHIPVRFDNPLESDLMAFFDAMEYNKGKKVHLHCAANKRVTVFLGLFYLIREKMLKERAFEPMWEIWRPDSVWSLFIESMAEKFQDSEKDKG